MIKNKIKKVKNLKKIISDCKKQGQRIVFTNGCFDLLHLGHIKYLERAKAKGGKLIVAVNSDASVRRLKGNGRPVVCQKDRAALVAACGCVDFVVIFSESTPLRLIKALKPDVLVKGADWRKGDVVGADFVQSYGGKVAIIAFVPGYSSSSIIARIKKGRQGNCLR